MAGLATLDDRFRPWAEWLYNLMRSYDSRFVITSARRTPQEQIQLYDRMMRQKAAGEPYYTTAVPGTSPHERGLAIDVVRFGVDPREDGLLHQFGRAWQWLGGRWGGDADPIHFGAPKGW